MIFGFFSRWKKAGKATGVTGGAGKLCQFDKDGNVISSGVDVEDLNNVHLYRHNIEWFADDDSTTTFNINVTIYDTNSSPYTPTGFYNILPTHDKNPISASGWMASPILPTIGAVRAVRRGTDANKIAMYGIPSATEAEFTLSKDFGEFSDSVTTII